MSIEERPLDEVGAERWDLAFDIAKDCGFDSDLLSKKMLVSGQIGTVMNGLLRCGLYIEDFGWSVDEVKAFTSDGIAAYNEAYPEVSA